MKNTKNDKKPIVKTGKIELPIREKTNQNGKSSTNGVYSNLISVKSKTPDISIVNPKNVIKMPQPKNNTQSFLLRCSVDKKSSSVQKSKEVRPSQNVEQNAKTPENKGIVGKMLAKIEKESKSETSTNKVYSNTRPSTPLKGAKNNQKIEKVNDPVKNELIDVCTGIGIDTKWMKDDFNRIDSGVDRKDAIIEIQFKLIKLIASKVQKDGKDRMKIEKQFEELMEKYSKQMELIDDKIKIGRY